jgi:hypothetical protein
LEEKRFTCNICRDAKLRIGEIVTLSCQPVEHRFCKGCFTGYCVHEIDLKEDLVCPAVGCRESITPNELKANVTQEEYKRYEHNELKKLCQKNKWKPVLQVMSGLQISHRAMRMWFSGGQLNAVYRPVVHCFVDDV